MTVINFLLDILFPKVCLGCGREGKYICKDCEVFLSEVPPAPGLISVWEYEGLMEKLIQKIKFDGCYNIIEELVERAFEKINLKLPEDTVITFVPMYKKREKQRGFNQAELIAKKIGEKINRPVVNLLDKTKDNRSQVGLNPQERMENMRGVFGLRKRVFETEPPFLASLGAAPTPHDFKNSLSLQNILLVDDVYTTGATMAECTKVLRKSGAKNVYGFTIARKLRI
jgi:competence protein ComFC